MTGTQSNFRDQKVEGENRWAIRDAYQRAQSQKLKGDKSSPLGNSNRIPIQQTEPEKRKPEPLPLLKLSDELYDLLDDMNNPIARAILEIESSPLVHNGLRIELVDVAKSDWCFDVKIRDKNHNMKIGRFIRYYFNKTYTHKEIFNFSEEYNKLKGGTEKGKNNDSPSNIKLIDSSEYGKAQDPKNIKSTFISLVTKTYPYGHEEEVMHLLPKDLTKDEFGNYYKIIGKSTTMFTSHLDTADREKSITSLYEMVKNGETYITTDGTSILGADDKAGVTVMLYMMSHNIPGVYYFFIGEERGGIGSGKVAGKFEEIHHLQKMKKCVSFDRRNYYSIITSQMGRECCSDGFATALSNELNKYGLEISLDPTGIYTDSANFVEDIPECTNISVGYFNEHTESEYQNITYLEKLCKASIQVDWEGLPIVRKVGFGDTLRAKYRGLFKDFRRAIFHSEIKIIGEDDKAFIKIDLEDSSIGDTSEDFMILSKMLKKNNIDPDIYFSDQYVKIELK